MIFFSLLFCLNALYCAGFQEDTGPLAVAEQSVVSKTYVEITLSPPQQCHVILDVANKIHFLEPFGCAIRQKSTMEMLTDLTNFVVDNLPMGEPFYSEFLDKVLCEGLRGHTIEPEDMARKWCLQDCRQPHTLREGTAIINVVGSLYKFNGTNDDVVEPGPDVQGYKLDRKKANSLLNKQILVDRKDGKRLSLGRAVATFDALGPTNYWLVSPVIQERALSMIYTSKFQLKPQVAEESWNDRLYALFSLIKMGPPEEPLGQDSRDKPVAASVKK